MKHTVRAFAAGLIVAGLLLLGIYLFQSNTNNEDNLTTEELITRIEAEGLRVITESEYISFSVSNGQSKEDDNNKLEENEDKEQKNADNNESAEDTAVEDEEENEDEDNKEKQEKKEESTPSVVNITVEPGMASSSISEMLEELELIEDANSFNQYLLKHDYSLRIQMGDHELRHGMSHYEIAESLTN